MMQAALPWPEDQTVALTRLLWRFSLMLKLTNVPEHTVCTAASQGMQKYVSYVVPSSAFRPAQVFACHHKHCLLLVTLASPLSIQVVDSSTSMAQQHVCSGLPASLLLTCRNDVPKSAVVISIINAVVATAGKETAAEAGSEAAVTAAYGDIDPQATKTTAESCY